MVGDQLDATEKPNINSSDVESNTCVADDR